MSRQIRVVVKAEGMFWQPEIKMIDHGLESMQALVTPSHLESSNIECVYVPELAEDGIDLWVNEEGKFNGCKPNFSLFGGQDVAFGPVFFSSSDDEGETVSLSDAQVKTVMEWLAAQPQAIAF